MLATRLHFLVEGLKPSIDVRAGAVRGDEMVARVEGEARGRDGEAEVPLVQMGETFRDRI
jgi:hypothetical protein